MNTGIDSTRDNSTCINNLNIDTVDANNDFPSADDDINDREAEYVQFIIPALMKIKKLRDLLSQAQAFQISIPFHQCTAAAAYVEVWNCGSH
jgi:hypothetical protein